MMTTVASPNEIEVTARAEERVMDLTHWKDLSSYSTTMEIPAITHPDILDGLLKRV